MGEGRPLSHLSTIDESISANALTAPGRGALNPARLEEHLCSTAKRLKKLDVRFGDCVASVLPEGPDAVTARHAVTVRAHADYSRIDESLSREEYDALLLRIDPKLLLMHPGDHPVRDAARSLGIQVANVLRHFEAGVFTLEAAVAPYRTAHAPHPTPAWKDRSASVPLVLIAPGLAYRRLASRLDASHPVISITPPSLEHLPPPHTIEHVAAECVRVLRRYRPQGPYALAGWRSEGLVAVEMARLLEEEGEQVAFVAMLDASELFLPATGLFRRAILAALKLLKRRSTPGCPFMAEALRQYRPHAWYGRILHIYPSVKPSLFSPRPRFEWRSLAPQGVLSYSSQGEILAEPGMQTVAGILAAELARVPRESAPGLER